MKSKSRGTYTAPLGTLSEEQDTGNGFPVVGIGASAGGLAAFEAFFSGMPADGDPDMAFVLVQHLAPDHSSILSELVSRYTRMRVLEVQDGMTVEPNCAYIIPPNRDMAFVNGKLSLTEPAAPRGHRLPIDFFFRSLAEDQHERAVGIVLSGTGSDGTQGVRAIKGEGGMVMAQAPDATEYDGMPRSAIATGLVDYELHPAEMAPHLIAYATRAFDKTSQLTTAGGESETALEEILLLLRSRIGHDFSQYKTSTIRRRIERRMAMHQISAMDRYVSFMKTQSDEADALFREMMIGVTGYFRDPECYATLDEKVITELVQRKSDGDTIRVWSAGCSTGEEAYSLAMLLREHLDAANRTCQVQVFGTDIDGRAIAVARAGLYPAGIAADVSAGRLARFFIAEETGSTYRVSKSIRESLIFSEQDIVKDPPFSKLDLISCRNVLIYMGSELQRKIITVFHYALNPAGVLFLGNAETIGAGDGLFSTLDRKSRLFEKKDQSAAVVRAARRHRSAAGTSAAPREILDTPVAAARFQLRQVTEQTLLRLVAPAAALVDSHGDILYIHGRTGMYLEPAPGDAGTNNITKMAREGLRHDLITALHRAVTSGVPVSCLGLQVKTNGDFTTVDLSVTPLSGENGAGGELPLFLVVLANAPHHQNVFVPRSGEGDNPSSEDVQIVALRTELRDKEEYLQAVIEELETSNEELKSSNEEMQSINEELATVNAELQTNLSDLARTNNDMNNLLSGTGIGTIFVDHQLLILRFTPASTQIINLIPGDVGRPVGHVASNLVGYDDLVADTQGVLDTLIRRELEVQTTDGEWYTLRILPYRTIDNIIEGAVITFFDITETVRARERINDLLHEKELLLKEVHHRVKNNMSTIVGLLSLQSDRLDNPEAVAALTDAQGRINIMASLYDKFYRSEGAESIPMKEYIAPLIQESIRSFPGGENVVAETDIDDIVLDARRLFPLGIIMNELLTNIRKHAFVGRAHGRISVSASVDNGQLTLTVADDGNGMPDSTDFEHSTGFGLTLVKMLADQLGGKIRLERDHGTRVILQFEA